jgi:hypothetical protein
MKGAWRIATGVLVRDKAQGKTANPHVTENTLRWIAGPFSKLVFKDASLADLTRCVKS